MKKKRLTKRQRRKGQLARAREGVKTKTLPKDPKKVVTRNVRKFRVKVAIVGKDINYERTISVRAINAERAKLLAETRAANEFPRDILSTVATGSQVKVNLVGK